MKDYYYILGVARTASSEEIRQAYRKLSVKFHPDKNDGDKFFEDRFKEINEAYEALSDDVRRQQYDTVLMSRNSLQERGGFKEKQRHTQAKSTPPIITFFRTDKTALSLGETITFEWDVQNSTYVELRSFGKVGSIGKRTVKPLKFNQNNGLYVELYAINEATGETVKREAFICKQLVTREHVDTNQNSSKKVDEYQTSDTRLGYKVIFTVIIILIGLLSILLS